MINKTKILKAIKEVMEKYPQELSDEHIIALLELYADDKLKKLKMMVINDLKDLIEEETISKETLSQLIDRILTTQL